MVRCIVICYYCVAIIVVDVLVYCCIVYLVCCVVFVVCCIACIVLLSSRAGENPSWWSKPLEAMNAVANMPEFSPISATLATYRLPNEGQRSKLEVRKSLGRRVIIVCYCRHSKHQLSLLLNCFFQLFVLFAHCIVVLLYCWFIPPIENCHPGTGPRFKVSQPAHRHVQEWQFSKSPALTD